MDGDGTLIARTNDGLGINVTASFQYQLIISLDNVVDLYYKWGPNGYEAAFGRMARSVLRDALAEFAAIDMFKNRTGVTDMMRSKLTAILGNVEATLQNFQLLDIKLPSQFSATIQSIEKYKQDLTSAQFMLQAAQQYAGGVIDQALQENAIITQTAQSYQKQLVEVSGR